MSKAQTLTCSVCHGSNFQTRDMTAAKKKNLGLANVPDRFLICLDCAHIV